MSITVGVAGVAGIADTESAEDEISNFISPVDRNTDFEKILELTEDSRRLDSLLPFTFRETLVNPVPFGKNERLSPELALKRNESALKLTYTAGYSYSKLLDLYVLARHKYLEGLALSEISDSNFSNQTHGTQLTFVSGCRGPLCKRARRIQRVEAERLKRTREHYETRGKVWRPTRSRYEQLKFSVPQYAAVEPLLTALTIAAHLRTPPSQPSKTEKLYLTVITKTQLITLLTDQFGVDAFGFGQFE